LSSLEHAVTGPSLLRLSPLAGALLLAFAAAAHAEVPAPQDTDYAPGTIVLEVDASNTAQRLFRVKQTIPVQPGPLTLLYPQWLPGNHGPRGPVDKLAGLTITANGQKLAWKRDPADVYAFHLDVPQGTSSIVTEYQTLTPADRSQGRVVMTPNMLNLQFNTVVLYPAGHYASRIQYDAKVKYPAGWQAFTALEVETRSGDTVDYRAVPLDILADSPVFAGRYAKTFDLAPGARVPVRLNVVADAAKFLEAKDEHIAQHRKLVQQALKLYGAQHYDHYDFLLSLSKQQSGIGLEHQRSSENGVDPDYFTGWDKKTGSTDLLGHEYTHSWNGKYRRPADLWTPNYNVPMQDSLLWVYEGQTQYWGNVLTARAGLRPMEASREALALTAATYADNRPGLQWRSVQDTTNDPIITPRAGKPYRNWQLSEDYYSGAQMMWLEADALIRKLSRNRKSLDDFARAFFGVNDGEWKRQNTYTFDDVVTALNGVAKYDWAKFLRDRLDGKVGLTGGLEASGWRLVYKDEPSALAKARAKSGDGGADFTYSLGLNVAKDGLISEVRWDGPAFDAGVGTGMALVAVNDIEYSKEAMEDAIKAAKTDRAPVRLLLKEFDRFRTIDVDYHDGLRYPHLERIAATTDYLTPIFSAK
jgi:predicted metalloprotease with PDZ domain